MTFCGPVHKGIITFKLIDKINMAIKVLITLTIIVIEFDDSNDDNWDDSTLSTFAWNLSVKCSLVTVLLSASYQLKNYGEIIKFFHLLDKLDNQVWLTQLIGRSCLSYLQLQQLISMCNGLIPIFFIFLHVLDFPFLRSASRFSQL